MFLIIVILIGDKAPQVIVYVKKSGNYFRINPILFA